MRTALSLILSAGFLILQGVRPSAADEPEYKITYAIENSDTTMLEGQPPNVLRSGDTISRTLTGNETERCQAPGDHRKSSVSTFLDATANSQATDRLSANLKVSSIANGGHYRTCDIGCDACLLIHGKDTTASDQAVSRITAKIEFSQYSHGQKYLLKSFTDNTNIVDFSLKAPDGSTINISPGQQIDVTGTPNSVYFVSASISVTTSNRGGCCSDRKSYDASLELILEKVPILFGNRDLEPYIVGGKQPAPGAFEYVVAVLIDGEMDCSGTIIGPHTILSAAHCINGYETQIKDKRATIISGQNINAPDIGPLTVVDATYPRGSDRFIYDADKRIHDIGLFYTDKLITAAGPKLPTGASPWSSIVNKKTSLSFVGYGYNKDATGKTVLLGVKREAPWIIADFDDWRAIYELDEQARLYG